MLVWEEEVSPSTPHTSSLAPSPLSQARAVHPSRALPVASSLASPLAAAPALSALMAETADTITTNPSAQASHAHRESAPSTRRVSAADKRIINGQTDVNQLVPFKYKWAWEKYLATCANHWMPQEVNMSRDISTWKDPNGLTEDEPSIIKRSFGFFATGDSVAAYDIVL